MAEFDPRQLDQLEDALEQLEHVDDLADFELEPELSERLREYQDVLALCREAFPPESPPDGALTEVLQEAREVSRRPRSRGAEHGQWRRFWERWRGTLVPGFALAGTAAAVLWLLDPQSIDGGQLVGKTTHEQRQITPEVEPEPEHSKAASDQQLEEPTPLEAERVEPTPAPTVEQEPSTDDDTPPEKISKSKKSAKPMPAVAPAPAVDSEPMTKDDAWKSIERGDAARRKGDCDRARSIYDEVIIASPSAQTTSRAKAGIGLCLEQDRRDAEATKWYQQARSGDPNLDSWIERERDEQPLPGRSKKKSSPAPAPIDAVESL